MIYPLSGTLQHYAWGGFDYLPQLLKLENTANQPYAEWWLGAHPSSPSAIEVNQQAVSLAEFFAKNPSALGANMGQDLPYLLKILDVRLPLSIQIHPTRAQAEEGFVRENALGIALDSPKRIYKDKNHKPEMMIALSDFWLLHGFKTKAKIMATLAQRPSLAGLAQALANQDLPSIYAQIMQAPQAQLSQWLMPIIEQHRQDYHRLSLDNPDYWVLYSLEAMGISEDKLDPGLMSFYLFNIVEVKPGQGIFQDAGIPHAYLRGQNIELMACSDNVIRGGLTSKHVDIAELLKVIDYQEIEPALIQPAPEEGEHLYPTPAQDFALEHLAYQAGQVLSKRADSAMILLVMEGELILQEGETKLGLKQGQASLITANSQVEIQAQQAGYAVLARLPEIKK
ncbi:mannose-6-phosphate isomerase, class I [Pasteurellaceae bacterium RH1A]|nr:mannose-6-phosphate isomerase, class I [Pasteurellaceae bacterium RH1A]